MLGKFNCKGASLLDADNEIKGLRDDNAIMLSAGVTTPYILPKNSILFGVNTTADLEIYEDELCTQLIASVRSAEMRLLGFRNLEKVYLKSATDTEVTPIIYKR